MPFVLVGLFLVAFSIPLVLRKVPPNRWYGIRIAATFADEVVWYEANAASGRDMLILGILQVALGLVAPLAFNIIVLIAGSMLFTTVGVRRAKRMLRERRG
ncbi:MAG TPA: SdpI family protein [Thermoanaerobaculia bacterium]|nr:SdpI family protein [Thermoanaerobaculia bacterium]